MANFRAENSIKLLQQNVRGDARVRLINQQNAIKRCRSYEFSSFSQANQIAVAQFLIIVNFLIAIY